MTTPWRLNKRGNCPHNRPAHIAGFSQVYPLNINNKQGKSLSYEFPRSETDWRWTNGQSILICRNPAAPSVPLASSDRRLTPPRPNGKVGKQHGVRGGGRGMAALWSS